MFCLTSLFPALVLLLLSINAMTHSLGLGMCCSWRKKEQLGWVRAVHWTCEMGVVRFPPTPLNLAQGRAAGDLCAKIVPEPIHLEGISDTNLNGCRWCFSKFRLCKNTIIQVTCQLISPRDTDSPTTDIRSAATSALDWAENRVQPANQSWIRFMAGVNFVSFSQWDRQLLPSDWTPLQHSLDVMSSGLLLASSLTPWVSLGRYFSFKMQCFFLIACLVFNPCVFLHLHSQTLPYSLCTFVSVLACVCMY